MSIRKLQDLLGTGSNGSREPPKLMSQVNRSPSVAQAQYSPLGNGASRSPSYHNIPGVQKMFYHPSIKTQVEPVCPSPVFQVPAKKDSQMFNNSLFQGSRFTAAETNPTNNISNLDANNASNSLHSILHQLQNQYGNQPRNLEELLQKSFSSAPVNSLPQSPFVSSVHSPFVGGNQYNSQVQHSMGSEMSNLIPPMTLLETSLQNPTLLHNQGNKGQSNESVNKALVLQLAQILKQESESKIKSAIAELILKYRALGLLNNLSGNEMVDLQGLIKGTEAPTHNNGFQYQQQPQEIPIQMPQQSLVSLSCGLPMNPLSGNDFGHSIPTNMGSLNSNMPHHRVDQARRGLFAMDEAAMSRQSMEMRPPQEMRLQVPQSLYNVAPSHGLSISPLNNLNREMNSLNLNNQSHHASFSLSSLSVPERMEDLAHADLGTLLKHKVGSDEDIPGVYNKYERINKILKYKNKIRKWRHQHPVKRIFKGRSQVAGQKPRIKGKFVTIEEYQQYVIGDACKNEHDNSIKEEEF